MGPGFAGAALARSPLTFEDAFVLMEGGGLPMSKQARHEPCPARSPRRFQSVVFDFDYTLADSSVGVIECMNYALKRWGCLPPAPSAYGR